MAVLGLAARTGQGARIGVLAYPEADLAGSPVPDVTGRLGGPVARLGPVRAPIDAGGPRVRRSGGPEPRLLPCG